MKTAYGLLLLMLVIPQWVIGQSGFSILQHGPALDTPRMDHMIHTTPSGDVVLFGGHTYYFALESTGEWYDTATQQWTTFPMHSTHDMGGMTVLQNGKWLIFGGCSSGYGVGQLDNAELFDPATKTSTPTGAMTIPRTNCRGATLSDGRVLVVGNWYNDATFGDVYDPATGTFTATGALAFPRSYNHVFPTNDGGAVVIGGTDNSGYAKNEAIEYYDPVSNTFSTLQNTLIPDSAGWLTNSSGSYPPSALQLNDGRYVFLATRSEYSTLHYRLVTFDPATKTTAVLETHPPLPTRNLNQGDSTAFMGDILVDKAKNMIYIFGVYYNTTSLFAGLYAVDVDNSRLYTPSALQKVNYYYGFAIPVLLHNKDIMLTGGSWNANFGAHDSVTIIRPSLLYTGVKEHQSQQVATMYPNPATDFLNISLHNGEGMAIAIVVDATGRKIRQLEWDASSPLQIDIKRWVAGLYFISIRTEEAWYQQTLLKQ